MRPSRTEALTDQFLDALDDDERVAEKRARAARAVAAAATDADDCAELLDALALKPEEGLARRGPRGSRPD